MRFSPETFPVIEAHEPAGSDGILATCDAVCLKNADGVWIIVHEDHAVDANHLDITINVGTTEALAEAGGTQLGSNFPAWACLDCATSDALVRQTDAATYELDSGAVSRQIWVFYVSAASLAGNSYDWIQPEFTAGDAGNTASVLYILDRARYQQETPPTAVA